MASDADVTEAEQRPPPSDGRRLSRWALVVIPIGAVAYALLLSAPGLDSSTDVLSNVEPLAILTALVCEVIAALGLGQAYRAALAAVGPRLRFSQALNVSMSAFTVTQVLPAGGAVGAVLAVHRFIAFGASRAAAAAGIALFGALSLLTLAMIVAMAIAATLLAGGLSLWYLTAVIAVVAVLATVLAGVLATIRSPRTGNRILDLAERALRRFHVDLSRWRRSLDEIAERPPDAAHIWRVIGWSAVKWVTDAAALWAIFAGLGVTVDPATLMIGFGLQHVAVLIPISPGGLGLIEAGMAGTFTALGVSGSVAVPAVLGYRIFSYWLPLLAGVPQYLRGPRLENGSADAPVPRGQA